MGFANEGRFRGTVISTSLVESTSDGSKAIGLGILARWEEFYFQGIDGTPDGWNPIEPIEDSVNVWLVKKDGVTLNQEGIKQLGAGLGWRGDWNELRAKDWSGSQVQCAVKAETYKNAVRHKASWLYAYDAAVGAGTMGRVIADDRFAAMSRQFGGQTRALCGGPALARPSGNPAAPPSARPASPYAPSAPRPAAPPPVEEGCPAGEYPPPDNETPF